MDRGPPPVSHDAFKGARTSDLQGHSKKARDAPSVCASRPVQAEASPAGAQVHSVAWNCTGRKLASGSVDRTARVWDIHHVRCPNPRTFALATDASRPPTCGLSQGKGDKAEAELKGHTGAPARRRRLLAARLTLTCTFHCAQTAWTSCAGTPATRISWRLPAATKACASGASRCTACCRWHSASLAPKADARSC